MRIPAGQTVPFERGFRHDAVLQRAPGGGVLIELGCAEGRLAGALLDRYQRAIGVDVDADALAIAETFGVETVEADLNVPLRFDSAIADAVLALEVIEHVLRPDLLLGEVARLLRPGGLAYVSTPNVRHLRHLYELVVRGRFPNTAGSGRFGYQGGHLHFFTWRDTIELVEQAGLRVVERVPLPLSVRVPAFRAAGILVVAERQPATRTERHRTG